MKEETVAYIPFKYSKICRAIEAGDIEKVTELLDKGVDPNLTDEWNSNGSLLKRAIQSRQKEAVILLIERGARGDEKTWEGSYLHIAAETGHLESAQFLLEKYPELIKHTNRKGQTPLHTAAYSGHAEIAALLVAKGANPDAKDYDGRTALYHAASHGHKEAEEVLLPVTKKATMILSSFEPRHDEEWKMLSPEKVARITFEQEIGYRITDIFNFKARDRIRIVQNMQTKNETAETKSFDELPDRTALEEALAELNKRGGKADPSSVGGLQKNRMPPKSS